MTIEFSIGTVDVDNLKKELDNDIQILDRYINPDEDEKEISYKYRIETAELSIKELEEEIVNLRKLPGKKDDINRNDEYIEIHREDIEKFKRAENEMIEAISRLKNVKAASEKDICLLTVPYDTDKKALQEIVQKIDARLEVNISAEEKLILIVIKQKIDNLLNLKNEKFKVDHVNIYFLKSEIEYVNNVVNLNQAAEVHKVQQTRRELQALKGNLEKEQKRLKGKHTSADKKLAGYLDTPISAIDNQLQDMQNKINPTKMEITAGALNQCYMDIQREKDASFSLKDKLKSISQKFNKFIETTLGIKMKEPQSKTLTFAHKLYEKAQTLKTRTELPSTAPTETAKKPKSHNHH